jgi:hypothetical protein
VAVNLDKDPAMRWPPLQNEGQRLLDLRAAVDIIAQEEHGAAFGVSVARAPGLV